MEHERQHLGWDATLEHAWREDVWRTLGAEQQPGRVSRIDRGWSSVIRSRAELDDPLRIRNIGSDVAVGDWVVPDADLERVEHVLPRRSALVRRASFEGERFEADTLAANIDVVFLVHALTSPPNERRLERELVLAYDSGATPVIVLTKLDLTDDPEPERAALEAVSLGVPVLLASGITGEGIDAIRIYASDNRTLTFLGSSGVGKSTLVNALLDADAQATAEVREGDDRGRHTTVAAQLLPLPGEGWVIDTPGVRAVSLWLSGDGIERAFADIFDTSDDCRFRDCKHDQEPGCAVQEAITAGTITHERLNSLRRLVAEEAALEAEQQRWLRRQDRRGARRRPSQRP